MFWVFPEERSKPNSRFALSLLGERAGVTGNHRLYSFFLDSINLPQLKLVEGRLPETAVIFGNPSGLFHHGSVSNALQDQYGRFRQ